MRALAATLVFLSAVAPVLADVGEDIDALLAAAPGPERDALLSKVVKAAPTFDAVADRIRSRAFPAAAPGVVVGEIGCADGVERPWALEVPGSYDPGRPAPLLVVLHGGVSRAELIEDPAGHAKESSVGALARERGWLCLHPFGQAGATWWDDAGMAMVRDLVRRVKTGYNVDDDRVWLGGYSDGASAAFLYAMISPTDYGAFLALSGHMGVGSLSGKLPTYAPNLANTPVYAVTSFEDELYPSARMRPTIEMARRAGADILYRELPGRHDFSYADSELPRTGRFLERHPRDPFPPRIVWEAGLPRFGLCRWFSIERVTPGEAAPWHRDFNVALVSDRVSIGFSAAPFDGEGVKVGTIHEDTFAEKHLEEGDVIVSMNDGPIRNLEDLSAAKAPLSRGDEVTLVVRRGEEEVGITGRLPEPENYNLFRRTMPSARAEVEYAANRFVVRGSRLGAFRILVHPDMVDLGKEVTVVLDGVEVFRGKVAPDVGFLLRRFLANRDRRLLYAGEIAVGR